MRVQGALVCLFFYLMFPTNIIGLWWAVGSPLAMDPNSICRKSRKLAGRQRTICRKEPAIVADVVEGAKIALKECQYQFKIRKWNCTTVKRSFKRILRRDYRETAFIYAITAAGVVYRVTQSCSTGTLLECTCENKKRDKETDGEWEWGGCGDNVEFGYLKSKEFMDARRKKRRADISTKIQLHNNEAGRRAVTRYMRTECKCHGLSGSCTLKTCWRKMPRFREVGIRIKERFDGSVKVMGSNDGKSIIPEGETIKPPDTEDLIYSENSPNFCKPSKKDGSLGTKGRQCDPNSMGVGGCDLLCCHRNYTRTEVNIVENCQCRFYWCCKVKCERCSYMKTTHTCT